MRPLFSVVYEEPLVQCFYMSAEHTVISDHELYAHTDISEDIDIHNIHSDMSVILYDTSYIYYGYSIKAENIHYESNEVYTAFARYKDLVYSGNTILAHKLNRRKFDSDDMREYILRHNMQTSFTETSHPSD